MIASSTQTGDAPGRFQLCYSTLPLLLPAGEEETQPEIDLLDESLSLTDLARSLHSSQWQDPASGSSSTPAVEASSQDTATAVAAMQQSHGPLMQLMHTIAGQSIPLLSAPGANLADSNLADSNVADSDLGVTKTGSGYEGPASAPTKAVAEASTASKDTAAGEARSLAAGVSDAALAASSSSSGQSHELHDRPSSHSESTVQHAADSHEQNKPLSRVVKAASPSDASILPVAGSQIVSSAPADRTETPKSASLPDDVADAQSDLPDASSQIESTAAAGRTEAPKSASPSGDVPDAQSVLPCSGGQI